MRLPASESKLGPGFRPGPFCLQHTWRWEEMNIAFTPVLKVFSAQPPVQWFELVNIPQGPQPLLQLLSE